jgi:hypothetical protein
MGDAAGAAWVRRWAVLGVLPLALALVFLWSATRGFAVVDTYQVLDGVGLADRCLHAGTIRDCGDRVGAFALLQYIPAFVAKRAGASYETGFDVLVALSALSFALLFVLGWLAARSLRRPRLAVVFALVLLTGPMLWYAHASYGESFAAACIAGMAVAVLLGAPVWVLAPAVFLATISKETALPFVALVVALSLVAIRAERERWRLRRAAAGFGIGAFAGVAANLAFNEFRYGTLHNTVYASQADRVPAGHVVTDAAAIALAPGGGLLWMWPSAVAVLVAAALCGRQRRRSAGPALTLLALIAVMGLWFSPMGGFTWGPRLLMPWIPALVLIALVAAAESFDTIIERVLRTPATIATTVVVLLVLALPHVAVMVDSARSPHPYPGNVFSGSEVVIRQYSPSASCPTGIQDYTRSASDYFRCLDDVLWRHGFAPLEARHAFARGEVWLFAALMAVALAALTPAARTAARYSLM